MAEAAIDNLPARGASLAFYSLFSIGPTLLILVYIASMLYGGAAASQQEFIEVLTEYLGSEGASALSRLFSEAEPFDSNTLIGGAVGLVGFLFAAGAAFRSLEDSLNGIYQVRRAPRFVVFTGGIRFFASTLYAVSFGSILAFALFARTLVIDIFDKVSRQVGMQGTNIAGGLLTFATLFLISSVCFRYVSGARPPWRDVLVAAVTTAVLVMLGQAALQWYLASGQAGSLVGAAGSIVVVMLWVYYTSQIMLLGAVLVKSLCTIRDCPMRVKANFVSFAPPNGNGVSETADASSE